MSTLERQRLLHVLIAPMITSAMALGASAARADDSQAPGIDFEVFGDLDYFYIGTGDNGAAGGLGDDISDLPAAGAAPEWMSEKAISIGQYFVSSGVYTVFGTTFPTGTSKEFTDHLFKEMEDMYGGMWDFVPDPIEAAQKMIAHIDKKRAALGIDKARERVLYDMEMRRELDKV